MSPYQTIPEQSLEGVQAATATHMSTARCTAQASDDTSCFRLSFYTKHMQWTVNFTSAVEPQTPFPACRLTSICKLSHHHLQAVLRASSSSLPSCLEG